ncbi:IclR family transcriptional regulator [Mycolicibacterium sphagni]|uniref:IclR family transcriptional regulator n=1 Tax=Mycolicibacterium sphagni TaxID=1786 RepID=UPI0021F25820|nr:IclR family transcriptional regulator [Mycolicibacterium sphagni]MCV7177804.1 IclR family transcriptional regulator [Mycolicibacterium sphagni]
MATELQECAASGIDRADLILTAFDGPSELTLSQIARRTGVPRSSAHRMLEKLVKLRWIRRDGHRYQLGLRLLELGSLAVQQDQLHAAALPYMRELRRLTGLTVHLAVLERTDVLYLEKLEGLADAGIDTRVGGRRPAPPTSVGKVLLANSIEQWCDPLTAVQPHTSPTRQELAAIRQRGVAFDRGEAMPRIGCVGAPVGVKGDVVAAISVCGSLDQMLMNEQTIHLVQRTGALIYTKLGRRAIAI